MSQPCGFAEMAREDHAIGAEPRSTTSTTEGGIVNEIQQGNGKGILVAAVVGAAVGGAVALLFAPCSGRETRGWLAHRTREIRNRTTSAVGHGKDAVRRVAREIGRDAEDAADARGRRPHAEAGATNMRG
jgi:hypothetical protein